MGLEDDGVGGARHHPQGALLLAVDGHEPTAPGPVELVLDEDLATVAGERAPLGHRGVVAPPRGQRAEHRRLGAPCRLGGHRRGHGVEPLGLGRGQRGPELGGVVALEEAGVDVPGPELGVAQHPHEQVPVGGDAVDAGARQGVGEHPGGVLAGGGPGDDLGQHGVVVRRHLGAVLDAAVDAHPGSGGDRESVEAAGRRLPGPRRVLGVQARFDGVAGEGGAEDLGPEGGAFGHLQLQAHEVEPGDALGHRVLDLQPGVHLQEGEAAVGSEDELDGARVHVADGLGGRHRARPELGPARRVQGGRGALLDDLLVAALDGALPLEQVHHRPVDVAEDLHLDVAGPQHVGLDEHGPVAEAGGRLARRRGQRVGERLGALDDAHAPPAPARRRLHEHRPTERGDGVDHGPLEAAPGARATSRRRRRRPRRGSPPWAARARRRRVIVALAASFDPMASITSGGGPTNTSPAAAQARAKPACSARNP